MNVLERARSFLFVPANRPERIGKALGAGAHAVIVDLEDAVAPEAKSDARAQLVQAWPSISDEDRRRILVRINAADSPWHEADVTALAALRGQHLGGVVLPKAESVATLERVLAATTGLPLIPLIESAAGLHAIDTIARVHGVLRLAFGHLDFQLDLGMHCNVEEMELDSVRLSFVLASRRAGLPTPVDGVTVSLEDDARLAADTARSRRFGFGAKLCVHPRQLATVNEALRATPAQREWASRVLDANREHGGSAFRLDGQMIDAPVLQRARSFLED